MTTPCVDPSLPVPPRSGRRPTRGLGAPAALFPLLSLVLLAGCDRMIDREIEKNLRRADTGLLSSPDLEVVLCGTGSPLADPSRASACTAVFAGGQMIVVDSGPGSTRSADVAGLPLGSLSAVLLTHFHSDHIGDLGELRTQSWIGGRAKPLDVYGPAGTSRVVNGLNQAYASDVDHRVAHHGEAYMPREAAVMVPHDVELPAGAAAAATVIDRDGLRVTMFKVDHEPVHPAVGYRFDYKGRSVVVSGDTKKSASLIEHAKGADILIHEALQRTMTNRASAVAGSLGLARVSKLAADIADYHTSPVEAAEVARDAGVHHLVFSHLVPSPNNFLTRRIFLDGVSDVYTGEVTIGEDGMRFSLPPKS